MVSGQSEERPSRSWVGLYDSNILTAAGEQLLSEIDQAAYNHLLPRETPEQLATRASKVMRQAGKIRAVQLPLECSEAILLFYVSVLWRFHISTRREAKGVYLGPYASKFKEAIIGKSMNGIRFIQVLLSKITCAANETVIMPYKFRDGAVNIYEMIFGGFRAWVKCDRRPFNSGIGEIAVCLGSPTTIVFCDFEGTQSYKSFSKLVRQQFNRHGDPWQNRYRKKYGY